MGKVQKPTGWKDGELRQVVRPQILESKNTKVNLMKQSTLIGQAKKGKASYDNLPPGMIKSLETKQKIDNTIAKTGVNVDDIRQRLNIQAKPLSIKNAKQIKEQINSKFESNRSKTSSKGVSLDKLNKELSKKEQHDANPDKIRAARTPAVKKTKVGAPAKKDTKTKTTKGKK